MILQFFAAFIGAAGFGFLFHLQFKHIFPAALGGVLTWVIYVIATIWGFDVFISSLFASAFAAIYSEVLSILGCVTRKTSPEREDTLYL